MNLKKEERLWAPGLKLDGPAQSEDKLSDYGPFWRPGYDYNSDDFGLRYEGKTSSLVAGMRNLRRNADCPVGPHQQGQPGYYLQGQYFLDRTTLSLGARREKVDYAMCPAPAPV